ncbi:MAG: hypothetical protein ACYSWO_13000 [Planctomycetota bacterium]|jgi:hypothetical protein
MTKPPPIPPLRKNKRFVRYLIVGGVLLLVLMVFTVIVGIRFVSKHGLTEPIDRKFGDQNLKSTVAMLELHKIRFGKYPDSLRDLKYTGEWDQIWINGTSYYPSDDGQSYYVEVHRGWIGKPTLVMPDQFWQNTGYDERLNPKQ